MPIINNEIIVLFEAFRTTVDQIYIQKYFEVKLIRLNSESIQFNLNSES